MPIPRLSRTRLRRRATAGLAVGALLLGWSVAAQAETPEFVVGFSPAIFQQRPDAVATRIGVWFDGSWVDNDQKPGSVDLNHFNVLFDTRWKSFQAFLEMEYEREVGRDGGEDEREFEIEQAYLRFRPLDGLSLRAGRFNTPAGIWLPVHWSILMDTIAKPPHAAKSLLPEQQLGLEIGGAVFPEWLRRLDGQLDYALFAGVGNDRLEQSDVEGVTVGADVRLRLREHYLIGATAYRQKNDTAKDRSEHNVLLYGEARFVDTLTFRAEYLHQRRERPRGAAWAKTLDVGYAKLRWDFARWFYANYRVSYGDDDGEDGRTDEQLVNTFTLGVQPIPAVRVKFEYAIHDFSGRDGGDFEFWGTSIGVRF
ncbi:MAG: hypothetical protein JRH10_09650 [Deltaproteobacteria bacterium]|nr:hypothetical protein [Deltaproteobacteria bacterium]MBW2446891.1 hypothetical protein [Deltaproteobacteria bacterium]